MEQIKKFVAEGGTILEIGDFYGSGTDEVIQSMEEEGTKFTIHTTYGYYDLTLKPGDYTVNMDGDGKIVKSKKQTDEQDSE